MAHRSPLVTLGAVALWFLALLSVNVVVHPSGGPPQLVPPAGSQPPPSAAPTGAPSPAASPQPTSTRSADDQRQFPARVVYAGRTKQGGFTVAVAVLNGKAAAYICDGRSVEAWLKGSVDEDEVALTGAAGARATIEAELRSDGRLDGELELNGRDYDFRIDHAEKPAGVYRAKGSRTTVGWIVLPDGSQVGVATSGSTSQPAPALDPGQPETEIDGETVTVTPVSGDLQL